MHHAQKIRFIIFHFALPFHEISRDDFSRDVETRHSGPWPKSSRPYDFTIRNLSDSLRTVFWKAKKAVVRLSLRLAQKFFEYVLFNTFTINCKICCDTRSNGSLIMSPIIRIQQAECKTWHTFALSWSQINHQ